MEHRRRILRLGAFVIALAAVLRLLSAGFFDPFADLLQKNGAISLIMYLGTGTVIRFSEPRQPQQEEPLPTGEQTQQPTQEPQPQLEFLPEDLSLVELEYHCGYRPQLEQLLTQPLDWQLQGSEPTVLILHSHATECYTEEGVTYSGTYRTLDEQQNMLCIGAELARVLTEGGITVIHDTTLHDYPDYNSAYSAARQTVQSYLEQYPSIRMVLDLHRDASDSPEGQLVTAATSGGQRCAQLMMVVGTDAGGNYHPGWQENLALAMKLTVLLEQNNPGISRPISLRKERFNMDLSPGSLLVEVGAAGNSRQEALIAVNALAQSILQIANGTG